MSEFDYKSNSYKSKETQKESAEPKKRAEKVISGTVKVKKKSEMQKFASIFVPEDITDVKNYIIADVIIPGIKKAISDVVDALLFGSSQSKKTSHVDRISYDRFSKKDDGRSRFNESNNRYSYGYDSITFENRGEAEKVLSCMNAIMREYGMVRVADLYDLVGLSGSYTDNDYGWTSIRSAEVVRDRGEYKIKLPRATPID